MMPVEIEVGLAQVCGQLNAAYARLVDLVAEAMRVECWAGAGIHSCEQWVAWHTALSPARARQIVEIARRHTELPVTCAAFAAGELSVDQVAVVAHHTPAAFEAEVADFARAATVSQLRRTLRSYSFEETDLDAVERPDPTHVTGLFDDTGHYRLHALLDADDGAIIDAALREARDALFRDGVTDVTWCDALVEMATRSLGGLSPLPAVTASSPTSMFTPTVPAPTSTTGPPSPTPCAVCCCATPAVPWWACATVGPSMWAAPAASSPGPPAVWSRTACNRGRRVPGCGRHHVEIHHIVHWLDGGPTNTWNLVVLCPHHTGSTTVASSTSPATPTSKTGSSSPTGEGDPGSVPSPTPPDPRPLAVTGHWEHPTGERLQTKWIHFNPAPIPAARSG